MINFIGVSYFKQANISSFKNYFIFYGDNIERFDTLLNDEKVPEETKNKILELVKEMNYEKNYIGSSLAGKKVKKVYCLVIDSKNVRVFININITFILKFVNDFFEFF